MSGLTHTIRAQGASELERRLGGLLAGLEHRLPLMRLISAYFLNSTRDRFETGIDPTGKPWPVSIRAQLQGGVTLVDSGILRDSFTDDAGEDFAAVGTNDPRAAPLHFGATIKPKAGTKLTFQLPGGGWRSLKEVTIPPRPIVGVSQADGTEVLDIVNDYLTSAAA